MPKKSSGKLVIDLNEPLPDLIGKLTHEEGELVVKACFELVLGLMRAKNATADIDTETQSSTPDVPESREFSHPIVDNSRYDLIAGVCAGIEKDCPIKYDYLTCTRDKGHEGLHHAAMTDSCRGSWEEKKGGVLRGRFKS